jgi:hypothetical protein
MSTSYKRQPLGFKAKLAARADELARQDSTKPTQGGFMKHLKELFALVFALLFVSAAFGQAPTVKAVQDHCDAVLYEPNVVVASEFMSTKERSDLELCRTAKTLAFESAVISGSLPEYAKDAALKMKQNTLPLWYDLIKVYCAFNSEAGYIYPLGQVGKCPKVGPVTLADYVSKKLSKERIDGLFNQSIGESYIVDTTLSAYSRQGQR